MLSSSTVTRGIVLLEHDELGELHTVEVEADIALARCPCCRARLRVLPVDVLPRKQYSLAVISALSATYTTWTRSLRAVVWELLGERTPSHTTMHGWTEGLGAHALDLAGGQAGGAPFARFVVELEARVPAVRGEFEAQCWVDPRRYRSPGRRERLSAVASVIVLAQAVTGRSAPASVLECRRLVGWWSNSCVLVFPSRFSCTAIEHVVGVDRRRSQPGEPARRERCPIRTRSPPGASSRSRH